MKGTLIICMAALVFTVGYISMTHRAQTGQILLEVITDLNIVKAKIAQLLKKTGTEKVERSLAGDLKNIERKMEKITDSTKIVPVGDKIQESSILSLKEKTGPSAVDTNLMSNTIVDNIINSYLKSTVPMETFTKALIERPELLALAPRLLGLGQQNNETRSVRASEIPTTLMKNIIEEQVEPQQYAQREPVQYLPLKRFKIRSPETDYMKYMRQMRQTVPKKEKTPAKRLPDLKLPQPHPKVISRIVRRGSNTINKAVTSQKVVAHAVRENKTPEISQKTPKIKVEEPEEKTLKSKPETQTLSELKSAVSSHLESEPPEEVEKE